MHSRSLVASLTPREAQVFDLIVRGKRNKQIAYALGTSERTVKAHRHCVMEKLGVRLAGRGGVDCGENGTSRSCDQSHRLMREARVTLPLRTVSDAP